MPLLTTLDGKKPTAPIHFKCVAATGGKCPRLSSVTVRISWMHPCAKSAHITRTAKFCIASFAWTTHSVKQSAIYSAWQWRFTENVWIVAENLLSFRTTMNTIRCRCGVSAISAPPTNAMSYLLWAITMYRCRYACLFTSRDENRLASYTYAYFHYSWTVRDGWRPTYTWFVWQHYREYKLWTLKWLTDLL